jgi:hypothetical protein
MDGDPMSSLIMIWAALFATGHSDICSGQQQGHFTLQWSESRKIVSPDRKWSIITKPDLSADENRTAVLLRSCRGSAAHLLFTLSRAADVDWSADGERVMVINKPGADSYEVLFSDDVSEAFSVSGGGLEHLDGIVRQAINARLGIGRQIEFFLPRFTSWTPTGFVISVGGSTSAGGDGPMSSYCYGIAFRQKDRSVQRVLSANELKAEYGGSCRLQP